MRKVDKIIIHCSATPPEMDIGRDEIRRWHLDRGWTDIGYHYVIRRNGTMQLGRDTDQDGNVDEEVGAHTLGYNSTSIGICLVGGLNGDADDKPEDHFTQEQIAKLKALIRTLLSRYPRASVHGHNEFAAKACPCFRVKDWVESTDWASQESSQPTNGEIREQLDRVENQMNSILTLLSQIGRALSRSN